MKSLLNWWELIFCYYYNSDFRSAFVVNPIKFFGQGTDKDKRKDIADKEEKAKKVRIVLWELISGWFNETAY